ncbi:unnamed protein product, partial [Allacma fusca]
PEILPDEQHPNQTFPRKLISSYNNRELGPWSKCEARLHPVSRACLHFNSSVFLIMVMSQGFYMFVKYPKECCYLVNSLHKHWTSDKGAFKLSKKLTKYTVHEWIIISLPISMSYGIWTLVLIFIWDPEASQYLYSMVPSRFQNNSVLTMLAVFEFWNVSLWISICYFSSYLITCFVPRMCNDLACLQSAELSLMGSASVIKEGKASRTLMTISTEINLYNQVNSKINIIVKFSCLAMSIFGFFIAIRMIETQPGVALINLVFGFYVTILFVFNYGHAFLIPEMMKSTKKNFLVGLEAQYRPYVQRQLRAIPDCNIRVGEFYSFDRNSTPSFVDFVVNQTSGLLLTFR